MSLKRNAKKTEVREVQHVCVLLLSYNTSRFPKVLFLPFPVFSNLFQGAQGVIFPAVTYAI